MKKNRKWIYLTVLALAAFALGFLLRGGGAAAPDAHEGHEASEETLVTDWTCSMHPQIHQPKPGQCPICGMDLIPASSSGGDEGDLGPRQLKMSETARQLAGIVTVPAERRFIPAEVRMVGKVEYDETRLGYITSWVPGRLDRLYVDYTGIQVSKGDHLVDIYSPDLIATQEELIQALRAAEELKASGLNSIRETALETVDAVREKLRLWGLRPDQIEEIEQRGMPTDHLTIYASMGGIVIHKNAVEGMYVETGTRIYTIADLSHLWVKLDAYESDLQMIRFGQKVELRTEAYPGEVFRGKVAFIDPVLDARTRTVKVRVNVPNPDGRLKPEMFVHASVEAGVSEGGAVVRTNLAGKWICPMHPEIVRSRQEPCDICGMDLVTAESLGYVDDDPAKRKPPLIIPASAPLITGKRAVVYVEDADRQGVFEGREVVLGPRAGDWYVVREGLEEGENVVVQGNFKIDSAIQIKAGPSMMNPEGGGGGGPAAGHEEMAGPFDVPVEFKERLDPVYDAYFGIQAGLSLDDPAKSTSAARDLLAALEKVDMTLLGSAEHTAWMKLSLEMEKTAGVVAGGDLKTARTAFDPLSQAVTALIRSFGSTGAVPVYRYHCPMAFDNRGADWLQKKQGTENPYFGSAMFKCGSEEETLVGKK